MSDLANELLDSLTEEEIEVYLADQATEEHIVVGSDRYITVPEALKRIAVQFDHNVESVMFDCPRYWDGLDMSKLKIYINYMRPDKTRGMYLAKDISVDEEDSNIMHFTWTISQNVTLVKGNVSFLVCAKKTDETGNEENHWNSELNKEIYISEGLECAESIIANHPDIITDLLTRMDYVETIATPENMQEYVDTYFSSEKGEEELRVLVYEYIATRMESTTPEMMQKYIDYYLDNNPPLFVIGSEKPGVKCLWFNTGSGEEPVDTITLPITDDENEGIYAEVKGSSEVSDYNFDII